MVMPRKVRCERCRRHTDDCGELSARKLCDDCGMGSVWRNAAALRARTGPDFDKWRRATILALLNLDTSPTTSLGLISDDELVALLSDAAERVLPS